MDVIFTRFCFDNLYSLVLALFPDHLADVLFDFAVDDLSTIFRGEYDMVFTFPLRVC